MSTIPPAGQLRMSLIMKHVENNDNLFDSFVKIMCSGDLNVVNDLALYAYKSFNERRLFFASVNSDTDTVHTL